jgi:hypothetical protein
VTQAGRLDNLVSSHQATTSALRNVPDAQSGAGTVVGATSAPVPLVDSQTAPADYQVQDLDNPMDYNTGGDEGTGTGQAII